MPSTTPRLTRRSLLGAIAGASGLAALGTPTPRAHALGFTPGLTGIPTRSVAQGTATLPGFGTFHTLGLTWRSDVRRELVVQHPATFTPRSETVHAGALDHSVDGIPLYNHSGNDWAVHVVYACAIANDWLRNHLASGQQSWLDKTAAIVSGLCRRAAPATTPDGRPALFAGTEYAKPETAKGRSYVLANPWYGSFNNSTLLDLVCRLHQLTGQPQWRTWADQLANAYAVPRDPAHPTRPWFVGVDTDGHLWPDMTPIPADTVDARLSKVINGTPSGTRGLVTHAELYGATTATRAIIEGTLATMDWCRTVVRQPGSVSRYFADDKWSTRDYHKVNINTFTGLYVATGYYPFLDVAIRTSDDMIVNQGFTHTMESQNNAHLLRVRPGRHRIRRLTADGSGVVETATWTVDSNLTLTTRARWRISQGWLPMTQMADGPRAGWWIDEVPDASFQVTTARGRTATGAALDVERPDFQDFTKRWLTVVIAAGTTVRGYAFAWDGTATTSRTRTWSRLSTMHADAWAMVNGRRWFRICDGWYAGLWVLQNGTAVNVEGFLPRRRVSPLRTS